MSRLHLRRPSAVRLVLPQSVSVLTQGLVRARLSPRSVPPLPHSRLFNVSPRSSPSPELDSPLEEAVDELISAACNLEDVQVREYPNSTSYCGHVAKSSPDSHHCVGACADFQAVVQHLTLIHDAISSQSILHNSEDCTYVGSSVNYQEGRQQAGSRLI